MKTKDFIKKHNACKAEAEWALSVSEDMSVVWDALIEEGKYNWLLWLVTQSGVFPDSVSRKLACRAIRETPLLDGSGKVWDLLMDKRSRTSVEVAERYAEGLATDGELSVAHVAADAASNAATFCTRYPVSYDAPRAPYFSAARAAYEVSYATAYVAYGYASRALCYAAHAATGCNIPFAQIKMIAALGNPFKKED